MGAMSDRGGGATRNSRKAAATLTVRQRMGLPRRSDLKSSDSGQADLRYNVFVFSGSLESSTVQVS